MTESGVQVIVMDAFKEYEKETGGPRHEQNLGNFQVVFANQNRQSGALSAIRWMLLIFGSIMTFLGGIYTVIQIVRTWKGH